MTENKAALFGMSMVVILALSMGAGFLAFDNLFIHLFGLTIWANLTMEWIQR